jgi:sulfate transport system permease protein
MVLKSASDQCPAIAPAMARNSIFRTPMATPVAAVEVKEPTPRRLPQRVLPGFGLTLGYTMVYLSLLVLIPLSAVFIRSLGLGWGHFWDVVTAPRVLASLRLSFGASLTAALINVIFGLIVAWVLVRYSFPFKRLVDAMVDLPFALPTAVAGIALTALYAPNGWLGIWLKSFGISVAFTPLGIVVALTFIGLPFVVRTLQPVLEDLDREVEQAAATLGASALQAFARVILPALWPALLTGFALAFARAVGEYGSVIFIAGNMPMKSEIAPLLIVSKLEQYDYAGATAIAVVMLVLSFALMFGINALQHWALSRHGGR